MPVHVKISNPVNEAHGSRVKRVNTSLEALGVGRSIVVRRVDQKEHLILADRLELVKELLDHTPAHEVINVVFGGDATAAGQALRRLEQYVDKLHEW